MDPDRIQSVQTEQEDSSLYNAMIWALAIGIVVVIVTLFLTRPAPETFTELYFNNHQSLPRYTDINQSIPYSFSIVSHEAENTSYNITITREAYKLAIGCENPTLYLEKTEPENNQSLTRLATSDDPLLYMKDSNATITFSYWTRAGEGNLVLFWQDTEGKRQSYLSINESKSLITYSGLRRVIQNITSIQQGKRHQVIMKYNASNLQVFLDNAIVMNNSINAAPKGFLGIETPGTYSEISYVVIDRKGTKQTVAISYPDGIYQSVKVDTILSSDYKMSFYAGTSSSGSNETLANDTLGNETVANDIFTNETIESNSTGSVFQDLLAESAQATREYLATTPIDSNEYSLRLGVRLPLNQEIALGIKDAFQATYAHNSTNATLTMSWNDGSGIQEAILILPFTGISKEFAIDVIPVHKEGLSTAKVYIDYKLVSEIPIFQQAENNTPFVHVKYGTSIWDFSARGITTPFLYSYALPEEAKPVKSYQSLHNIQLLGPRNGTASIPTSYELFLNATAEDNAANGEGNTTGNKTSQTAEQKAQAAAESYLRYIFMSSAMTWPDYQIQGIYEPAPETNNTFTLTFTTYDHTLFALTITQEEDLNASVIFQYDNGTGKNITANESSTATIQKQVQLKPGDQHSFTIDANASRIAVNVDGTSLPQIRNLTNYTGGALFLESAEGMLFPKLQVENRQTGEIKIYRQDRARCSPTLLYQSERTENLTLSPGQKQDFNSEAKWPEPFDIGKLQVSLGNGTQEIHFWVVQQ